MIQTEFMRKHLPSGKVHVGKFDHFHYPLIDVRNGVPRDKALEIVNAWNRSAPGWKYWIES